MMLSDRQRLVLNAIVDDYIRSAEPVGSRSISKREDVKFSPATIRNEMADLEELGFLEQPHTSAGRVPSTKGYRYYVDHLVQQGKLTEQELANIKHLFAEKMTQMEQVMQHTASILSNMTNYTSIVLGHDSAFANSLRHFQLVPLTPESAVAIIVTSSGHVENRTISIPANVSVDDLQQAANIFNEKLVGVPLSRVKSKLHLELGQELARYVDQYEELLRSLDQAFNQEGDNRIFVSGTTNILNQPEFRDVEKVKNILELFEHAPQLASMLDHETSGISVKIGSENDHEAIRDCTLITATFKIDGENAGTLGIIGPKRMNYSKVISLMDVLSKDMAVKLKQFSGGGTAS